MIVKVKSASLLRFFSNAIKRVAPITPITHVHKETYLQWRVPNICLSLS